MGKVVLLTGAPGVGKSTLRSALVNRIPGLQAFDYGKLLLERKATEGVEISYTQLREQSSSIITPADVGNIDEWVIRKVNELRQHPDVILDSHALTAESYGLRAVPYSSEQLQRLKLDAVLVLRCDAAILLQRTRGRSNGRRDIPEEMMRELQILQEAVGISYAINCGCPIFFIDASRKSQDEVADVAQNVLWTVGIGQSAGPDK
jgi:adenylate kinase